MYKHRETLKSPLNVPSHSWTAELPPPPRHDCWTRRADEATREENIPIADKASLPPSLAALQCRQVAFASFTVLPEATNEASVREALWVEESLSCI